MSEDAEVEVEVDADEASTTDTWVGENEVVFFDPIRIIGGHEVFAAHNVAGDLILYTLEDLKGHKIEQEKGFPAKPRSQVSAIK